MVTLRLHTHGTQHRDYPGHELTRIKPVGSALGVEHSVMTPTTIWLSTADRSPRTHSLSWDGLKLLHTSGEFLNITARVKG